jgi:spore coat polysaccharide biosynthesis protein SpsF
MILAIIQARVSSTRLPAKVLLPILEVPMLLRQIERIRNSKKIDEIVIATSIDSSDDAIESLCLRHNLKFFRGSLNDVLDRFYKAAILYSPSHILRLTGDCPLSDPLIIDALIDFFLNGKYDYASNALEPTFPDGLDAEFMHFECLEKAWKNAVLPSHREHVTPFIYTQPHLFKIGSFKGSFDYSKLRWTVDERADYDLVNKIFQMLYPSNNSFSTADVLQLLEENPELKTINRKYIRNEGFQKSLKVDEEWKAQHYGK